MNLESGEEINLGEPGYSMDTLQQQVSILSSKVDALSERIEQLGARVSEVVTECKFSTEQVQRSDSKKTSGYRSDFGYGSSDMSLEHKDILVDSDSLDSTSHSGEKQLSPEIQIQRLMAQLTAAYNRIAALEEQLLSKKRVY